MLKEVWIKGFKSHQDTMLEFGPGVNTITGITSNGKSAIVDAIRLAALNDRTAKSIISDNEKINQCSVKVVFEECSVEIQKNKGSQTDSYILIDSEGEHEPFKNFSRKVPPEIQNAMKIDETNFHIQHAQPYLVYGGKAAYSKEINKIIGVGDTIDRLGKINSKISSMRKDLKAKKADYDKTKDFLTSLKECENIFDMESKMDFLKVEIDKKNDLVKIINDSPVDFEIEKARGILCRLKEISDSIEFLKKTISEKKELLKEIENFSNFPEVSLSEIKDKVQMAKGLENLILKKNVLIRHISEYEKINEKINLAKEKLSDFDGEICFNCGSEIKI